MTDGTANPKAQGHDATNMPIPRYNIQHMLHVGTVASYNFRTIAQTTIVKMLNIITDFTNTLAMLLQTA